MDNQKIENGKDLCFLLVNASHSGCQQFKETNDWETSYKDFTEAIEYVIDVGASLEDSLAFLAVGFAYNWKNTTRTTPLKEITKTEARQYTFLFFEKYLQKPEAYDDLCDLCYVYMSLAEAYEKEYDFRNAIKYFELYDIEFDKQFTKPPIVSYKKENGVRVKYLAKKEKDLEVLVMPNGRVGESYLKLGTQLAIDYWNLQMNSPYYEDGSYYKQQVDYFLSEALWKQSTGYVYKPQSKVDRLKFQQVIQKDSQ